MKKQAHIYYIGKVHGIGFRFTAQKLAAGLAVAGWVKNLADGRVEIIAQAEEEILKQFLGRVAEYFSNYITDTQVSWMPCDNEFTDFVVR